jgi:tRNA dimethylallyltransferase
MTVLIIAGPTGVGKSDLSFRIAKRWGAPIVSADAMTLYRGLDVGTAKPTHKERREIRHYGIDIRDIDQDFSAADFVDLVLDVNRREENLVIVGGTQFYLSALLKPFAPLPPSEPEVRQQLEALDNLHGRLQIVDAETALRLHPNDKVRIVRALEVHHLSGKPLSVLLREPPAKAPLKAEIIWMDRPDLRQRIRTRIGRMIEEGYLEECQRLIDEGWSPNLKPLRSFSYRFMLEYVMGEKERIEALWETEKGTWRLARKQRTWARGMNWTPIGVEEAEAKALKILTCQG